MTVRFYLNGNLVEPDVSPLTRLSDLLRDLYRLIEGPEEQTLILLDGEPVFPHLVPAFHLKGRLVTTYEGFSGTADCEDIETGFEEAHFCPCPIHRPVYTFLVHALLERVSHPEEADTAAAFTGFHPICGGYLSLLDGVRLAARRRFLRHHEQTR
ncbi:MAG: hypothetical protein JW760_15450 [Spirochaetales bacterium]|nr:hypothetical protein [Spirochaetales bacterium]